MDAGQAACRLSVSDGGSPWLASCPVRPRNGHADGGRAGGGQVGEGREKQDEHGQYGEQWAGAGGDSRPVPVGGCRLQGGAGVPAPRRDDGLAGRAGDGGSGAGRIGSACHRLEQGWAGMRPRSRDAVGPAAACADGIQPLMRRAASCTWTGMPLRRTSSVLGGVSTSTLPERGRGAAVGVGRVVPPDESVAEHQGGAVG